MGKLINLKGQRFGFWVALEFAGKNKNGQTQWLCQCECQAQKLVTTNSLRTGNSTSCGCNYTPDLINNKFGKLLVLELDNSKSKGRRFWKCQCECGAYISLSTYQLRTNSYNPCNCEDKKENNKIFIKEQCIQEMKKQINNIRNTSHQIRELTCLNKLTMEESKKLLLY